ncbi:hypothetical protein QTP88_024922 [Uroleucon formosanum]
MLCVNLVGEFENPLIIDLDNTDLENEIIIGEQLVNMLPTHMKGEEFFLVNKNLKTEEDSTDIKSFIITDNDEEETHEETEKTEEPEYTVSNYSEVLTQIKQLSAFTLQKVSVLFVSLTTVNTVFKMEFVESKRGKRMLIFDGFKYVFDYTSQTNVTWWRCFMKNCPANILEKEKILLKTKGDHGDNCSVKN